MTHLQKIVAKAKILKKSHPNTKWTDLIKKASKLVGPAKKTVSGVKKKAVEKKLYEVQFNNNPKNFDRISATSKTDAIKKIKSFYPKDRATKVSLIGATHKKSVATKKPARSLHKDTKSHNVNIRVVSGLHNDNLKQLSHYVHTLNELQIRLAKFQNDLKSATKHKQYIYANLMKNAIKLTKFQIATAKKHILLIKSSIK